MSVVSAKFKICRDYCRLLGKVTVLLWGSSSTTLICLFIFNLVAGLAVPVTTVIWKYFLDSVVVALQSGNISTPVLWIVIHMLYTQFNHVIYNICKYFESNQADYMNKHITELTLDKVAEMEMADFDDAEIFDHIQKVNNESSQHSMNILRTLITFLQNVSSMAGAVVIFLNFGPIVLVVSFFACLPSLLLNIKMSAKFYAIYTKRFERLRLLGNLKSILTTYENIKEIKVNRLNPYFKKVILSDFDNYLQEDKKIRRNFSIQSSITNLLENVISYSFQIYILITVISRKLTIGDLSLFVNTLSNFQNSLESILRSFSSLYEDGLYIQNLFSLLEKKRPESSDTEQYPFPVNFETIQFDHVYFKYPGSEEFVLKDVNLTLAVRKSYSIVGLNGSGKTTLIKLILGLYQPTKGEIRLGGIPLQQISSENYRKHIGAIFQDFIKYPFTIEKNIAVGEIDDADNFARVQEAARQAGADRFIEQLPEQYNTRLNKEWSNATQLSLGEWQKIAISRAFMADSSILILDEPTASLDASAEYELFTKFKALMAGKTTILITHRFSTIRLVDEIFVLKDGGIIESGDHESLLRYDGEYARLYKFQAEMYNEGLFVHEGSY
ncbi:MULTISPECIES: ABC transporter ATP-binding protein [unclassified Paenibacillus]|jgi:ABC-type multidrug transport system fused ATPase/permease subunit|uniref:ABC transporter ATP-binding protein n=1 Tax=unclassified Paenibacillus TaxID=185978 RepID=UPI00069475EB|nr:MULTISPECIES: ABC transporter ATP-binding protein [unclassified Paenibacillus]